MDSSRGTADALTKGRLKQGREALSRHIPCLILAIGFVAWPHAADAIVVTQLSPTATLAELNTYFPSSSGWTVQKTFHEFLWESSPVILVLQIEVEDGDNVIAIDELVTNDTDVAWTDYHLILANFDGTPIDANAAFDPASVAVANSAFADVAADGEQIFLSGGTVDPDAEFSLEFVINTDDAPGTGFLLKQYATPEPVALLLLAAGALTLRRRRPF